MFWFAVGIDPLLVYLEKRLTGIPISSLPVLAMQEFPLVNNACALLEKASGVKLHRDPAAGKVKFLALGRWRGTLTQEDIPHQYIILSEHLDFVGLELRATFVQTRKSNSDQLQTEVKYTVGPWKAGQFMPLTL